MRYLIAAARAKGLDRIAIAYGVAAWVVVQAASIAAPAYAWAPWVLQLIILVALLGLPVVLIGAWTNGVRAAAGGALKPSRTDWHVLATLGAGALVGGAAVVWAFWPHASLTPSSPETAAAAAPANSLAVLPFASLSGKADDYFADGIADELLNALAARRGLRIAARTSSFAFKGKNLDAQVIARALHVRNLVEGSVREAGNRVRILVELINASDGYQLWSQSYDRDLTDILAVQTDIANAISAALERTLGGSRGAAGAKPAPIDRDAYRMYLEAKDLVYRSNEEDLTRAAALLRNTTEKAPDFADGYALLGNAWHQLYERYNKAAALPPAETAYQQTLNLEPANVTALVGLFGIRLDQWRWNEALALFRKMQAANPNQVLVLHAQSNLAYIFNYPAEDLAAERKAIELDPLRPALWYDLALWYWEEQRYDEADAAIERVLQLRKGKYTDRDMQCLIAVGRGRLVEAEAITAGIAGYYKESAQNALSCPFAIAVARHDNARARAMLPPAIADYGKNGGSETTIAESYRTLGDLKSAMPWYERAYQARDTLLMFVPFEKYQSHALADYPPWKALWTRPPIRAWAAARVEAGKILGD
jgi:TolB-like protein/predicted Zn-dependent protease